MSPLEIGLLIIGEFDPELTILDIEHDCVAVLQRGDRAAVCCFG